MHQSNEDKMTTLIDTRTVGKLENFSGKAVDWSDWSFKATSWFALLQMEDGQSPIAVLDAARDNPEVLEQGTFTVPVQNFSIILFTVLVQVVQGKALGIVKTSPRMNGLEAWRRLFREYESSSGTRLNALLGGLLNPGWSEKPNADFMELFLR